MLSYKEFINEDKKVEEAQLLALVKEIAKAAKIKTPNAKKLERGRFGTFYRTQNTMKTDLDLIDSWMSSGGFTSKGVEKDSNKINKTYTNSKGVTVKVGTFFGSGSSAVSDKIEVLYSNIDQVTDTIKEIGIKLPAAAKPKPPKLKIKTSSNIKDAIDRLKRAQTALYKMNNNGKLTSFEKRAFGSMTKASEWRSF